MHQSIGIALPLDCEFDTCKMLREIFTSSNLRAKKRYCMIQCGDMSAVNDDAKGDVDRRGSQEIVCNLNVVLDKSV